MKRFIAGVVTICAVLVLSGCVLNEQTFVATVNDKDIKAGAESSTYLIYTELENGEGRVFSNSDNWFIGKYNSSDWYNDIRVGATYEFKTSGYRMPMISSYENIIGYTLIEEGEK